MFRSLPLLLLLMASCRDEKAATFSPPPAYQTLHHPRFKGAFFQFQHKGDHYLACSIHQAHLKPGTRLFRDNDGEPLVLEKRVHKQKDLHVWTFSGKTPELEHLLGYRPAPTVEIDERIFFLNKGKTVAARVVEFPGKGDFRYTYRTDEPFAAAGLSGSPVYLPRTGSVIGVLQTANDREQATMGGFELLQLP